MLKQSKLQLTNYYYYNFNSNTQNLFSIKSIITHFKSHPYHLVQNSPWPILTAFNMLIMAIGFIMYIHRYLHGFHFFYIGFFLIGFSLFFWWRDVIRESTFEGKHTLAVQKGLRLGMALFIFSEVMFFFAFFWAFFASSLAPSIQIGTVWPPLGIAVPETLGIPLINTILLVISGITIRLARKALVFGYRSLASAAIIDTLILALLFIFFQGYEYKHLPFTISDSIYGSVFYLTTGLHGMHVIVGTLFIFICLLRHFKHHFQTNHHVGFLCAEWYWHFVDVVWIFLFIFIYWWGI